MQTLLGMSSNVSSYKGILYLENFGGDQLKNTLYLWPNAFTEYIGQFKKIISFKRKKFLKYLNKFPHKNAFLIFFYQ